MLVLVGCFKPAPQEGFRCAPNGWCPPPLACAKDGVCRKTDVTGDGGGPDADAATPNVAFVTSMPFAPPVFGPPPGADTRCTQIANAAGHAGNFIAWLGNAGTRLGNASGWVRTDGLPVANTRDDLLAGKLFYPIRKDEGRTDRAVQVMTGVNPDGVGNGEDCNGLTSTSNIDLMAGGTSDGGTNRWTNDNEWGCDQQAAVYCLQIDHDARVPPPSATGRRAFITNGMFTPGGGVGAADTLCQGEANAAMLGGTYRAFLATTTLSAVARVTLSGAPFVRPDGVATTADFVTWDAPIDVTAGTLYIDDYVFSGASSPAATAITSESCTDWTSTSGSAKSGVAGRAGPAAFGSVPTGCGPHRVLCMQL